MADGYTISMSQGDHAEEHSRRTYTPRSADESLKDRNVVIYDCGDDKEHFNEFFRPAIEAYNARQMRADRKKSLDYYDALLDGTEGYGKGKQQEVPIYDDVIQIGNRETNGITRRTFDVDHWRALKEEDKLHEASSYVKKHLNDAQDRAELQDVLLDACRKIYDESANSREYRKAHGLPPGKYDNILIHRMILHADEPNGTPHVDMGYTIFTDNGNDARKNGRQNGLATRVSMTKGLGKMGFRTSKDQFALEQFRETIKDRIQEKMEERGYQRDVKGEHRRHLRQDMYEAEQRAKEAEQKKAQIEVEAQKISDAAEARSKKVMDAERLVSLRETTVAEAEIEISRRKKKQDDRQSDQDEREAKLKKESERQARITDINKKNREINQQNYEIVKKYAEQNAERERQIKEKEAALTERERAQDERQGVLDDREAKLKEAEDKLTEERTDLQNDRESVHEVLTTLKTALIDFEDLKSQPDADLSRKAYNESVKLKSGKTIEDMYQDHLRQLVADRKRKMDYFEGIANQYDQEYGSVDLSSVERQVGE